MTDQHGKRDWGGWMPKRVYLKTQVGVETLADAIRKNPALAAVGTAVAGAAAGKLTEMAMEKVTQANSELAQAQKTDAEALKKPKTEEGEGAAIEGMDSPQTSPPQVDGVLTAPTDDGLLRSDLKISRTWFVDNFGMTGSEMASLFIKSNEMVALDALYPLLIAEKQAILSTFPGVSPELVKSLPLTDLDYDSLNKYSNRLGIPFRRFIKVWSSTEDRLEKEESYGMWKTVIDANLRLSPRERSILTDCASHLFSKGALNAQTLKINGVSASTGEISSLIKSHGFLYDIISVGEVSKSVGRGLFYDIKRRDVILKDAGRFIAGLIDTNSTVKFDSRMKPRIEMRFNAPTAPWYADALNTEMGISCVKATPSGLCIEGEKGVIKAMDMASPYINDPSHETFMLSKALNGDKDALIVMVHDSLNRKEQVSFLKSKNVSIERFDKMKEKVMMSGR